MKRMLHSQRAEDVGSSGTEQRKIQKKKMNRKLTLKYVVDNKSIKVVLLKNNGSEIIQVSLYT